MPRPDSFRNSDRNATSPQDIKTSLDFISFNWFFSSSSPGTHKCPGRFALEALSSGTNFGRILQPKWLIRKINNFRTLKNSTEQFSSLNSILQLQLCKTKLHFTAFFQFCSQGAKLCRTRRRWEWPWRSRQWSWQHQSLQSRHPTSPTRASCFFPKRFREKQLHNSLTALSFFGKKWQKSSVPWTKLAHPHLLAGCLWSAGSTNLETFQLNVTCWSCWSYIFNFNQHGHSWILMEIRYDTHGDSLMFPDSGFHSSQCLLRTLCRKFPSLPSFRSW